MKIEFDYWSTAENRRNSVAIETAHDAHETVYIMYENGAYTFMTNSLFSLLQFVNDHYNEEKMGIVKKYFQ